MSKTVKDYPKEIVWAASYILSVAGRKKLISEQQVPIMRGDEEISFGSMDAYCKGHLFDLKTGMKRDYKQQMAAYALGVMQKFGEKKLKCHIVYSRYRDVETFDIDIKEAESIVYAIVDSVNAPTRSPWPCDYCRWCARKDNCTAIKHFSYVIAGQVEAMKAINLNEPVSPAVKERLLSIVDAMDKWGDWIKEKVRKR